MTDELVKRGTSKRGVTRTFRNRLLVGKAMGDRHQSDTFGLGPDLAKAKQGDREALETLLTKLRPYLHFLVRNLQHLLGSDMPTRMDYSDLVQEGLIRMHRGFAGFRGQTAPQLLAWVARIVERVLRDVNREDTRG